MKDMQPSTLLDSQNEALVEFNQAYRRYLDNQLLLGTISETLSISPDDDPTSHSNAALEEKLKENFLKTNLFASNPEGVADDLRPEGLSDEAKQLLCDKIEAKLDLKLNQVNEYLNFCKPDLSLQISSSDESYTLDRFAWLSHRLAQLTTQIDKYKADLALKAERTFNIAVEVVNLIKTILGEFKLNFYASVKSRADCESVILKHEMLEAKVRSVYNDLLTDIYSSEKIKPLSIIRSHVNMELTKTGEKRDTAQAKLDAYKAFGPEFDRILKTFYELKADLDQNNWTLKHLKANVEF
jgi:hypothetical protein